MSYDFSTSAPREKTNAEKFALREKLFGTLDVEPLWVADMDIDTPAFVLEAIKKRLEHPIVGYEDMPDSAYEAQIAWLHKRHGWSVRREDIFHSHSVVASMAVAIEAFTQKGDEVVVQTPVYPPFFHSVIAHERRLIKNRLKRGEDGVYSFDIEDFKSQISDKTKLLLLCSPHNPVGRVWRREELLEIVEICAQKGIVIFSDEIHSDIVYGAHKHIPLASLSANAAALTLTALGVGKSFNMAGFALSSVIVSNEELKERFAKAYHRVHFAQNNALSHVAFEAAYRMGEEWLEALLEHLHANFLLLEGALQKYSGLIRITPIEGTYLAWLDCRAMGLKDSELRDFFVKEAKLGLNAGISFGKEGSGFMRLNFALSSAKMLQIVHNLEYALQRMRDGRY